MDSGVGLISVRYFVKAGGLIPIAQTSQNSFSKHCILDRILKGERPTDLSVQAPTKYELAVNISSAVTEECRRLSRRHYVHASALSAPFDQMCPIGTSV